jgi:NAD(P)-dependent dehydrogenase (short-subunit alcohol dehydrogenase family)
VVSAARAADPEADGVVADYLETLRQAVAAGRDVVLSYLGAARPAAPDRPTVEARAEPLAPPSAPAAAPEAPTPAPTPALGPAEVRAAVVATVSERTGYPAEMLEGTLDLEADLSIDSIKRLEIVGELAERLSLGVDPSGSVDESVVEELVSVKTLDGIVEWLTAALSSASGRPAPEPAAPADGVGPAPAGPGGPAVPEGARRFVPRLVEVAAPEPGPIEGRRVVLTDDGRGVAPLLAALLREAGAEAAVVPPGRAMGEADVLVHLEALGRRSGPGALDLLVRVQEALAGGVSTVVAATSLDGELGYGTGPGLEAGAVLRGGGLRGVVRTLGRELPWTRARVVDLAPGTEPAAAAALLAAEVRATDGLEEVGWKDGRRTTLEVVAAEAPVPAGTGPALGPDSVVLVTGGARGVTSAVARALGARGAGRVVLAGRTPLPEGDEDPATATAPDAPALRRTLAQAGFGGPPAIEAEVRRLLAAREVRRTLTHLRDGGTRVEYRRADLSDPAEAAALLAGVRADHGRLDVVVHGAGILEDTRLVDKEVDSFRRVYDTKVTGAVALLDGLPDDVGAVVLFASVSGLFGNAGQVDYAAANEVLGHVARSLQARHPGCKVVAVDWGPWGGGGMVSAELEREFARRGVGLLDPGDAVSRLLEEMGRPDPDPEVVLMRATPGPFARPDSPEAVPAAPGRGGGA